MRVARVFPRKTNASPTDDLAFFGPPGLFPPEVDEVHVSVAFTWDLRAGECLAAEWQNVAPVTIGGPATGQRGEEFTPGLYLRDGYTITSRGCPNDCWFCEVPRRDGPLRELPIRDGWNVQDDNLLACSDEHIRAVFEMLRRQKHPANFDGGFEAARLKQWHVDELVTLRLKQLFLAYDDEADWEPFVIATKMLRKAGLLPSPAHKVRAYCLIGYPRDTLEAAEERLRSVARLDVMPLAMLWRGPSGEQTNPWRRLQREWANPVILGSKMRAA